jgi:hypothetical protein
LRPAHWILRVSGASSSTAVGSAAGSAVITSFVTALTSARTLAGGLCEGDTHGLLGRYPVTANPEFHLIGKETERGWEQAEDISTLLPLLKR